MIKKRDGWSELVFCGLVRPRFFCAFATNTAMDAIRLHKFVQLVLQFEGGGIESGICHGY